MWLLLLVAAGTLSHCIPCNAMELKVPQCYTMPDIPTLPSIVGASTGIKTPSSEFSGCQTPKGGVACLSHPHSFTSQLTAPSFSA